jgi:hypothetical protein
MTVAKRFGPTWESFAQYFAPRLHLQNHPER